MFISHFELRKLLRGTLLTGDRRVMNVKLSIQAPMSVEGSLAARRTICVSRAY